MLSSRDFDKKNCSVPQDGGGTYLHDAMFWSWYEPRNFGDWIGPYLYEAISDRISRYCSVTAMQNQPCLLTVGSILRHVSYADRAVVWGSGIISRNDVFSAPREIRAVRGPETRRRCLELGFACPEVYGDPAILLPEYYKSDPGGRRKGLAIAPHFVDFERVSRAVPPDVRVIDVTMSVEAVIDALAGSEVVLSSSLHGLIVAHAYGTPAVWIRSGTPIAGDNVKFIDYFMSLGVDTEPLDVAVHDIGSLWAAAARASCPDVNPLRQRLQEVRPF